MGSPSDPRLSVEVVEHLSRKKDVQPLELGPILIHDPLQPAGLPVGPGSGAQLENVQGATPPYFRIATLTPEMLAYEAVSPKADGFLCCVARPHRRIVGGGVYYSPQTISQDRLMADFRQFPVMTRAVSYVVLADKITVTLKVGPDDVEAMEQLAETIEDVYLITGRMVLRPTAPIIRHDVTPLIFKYDRDSDNFTQLDAETWEIECTQGQFGTEMLEDGGLAPGEVEYMTSDVFVGNWWSYAVARKDNLFFGRSGGNFPGDTDERRYIRVLTFTATAFGDVEESSYLYLDRNDFTMSSEGSFGGLDKAGNPNGDPGWWGVAVAHDYRVRILTSRALGYWRLGEPAGNAIDETLNQDAVTTGSGFTKGVSGALTGDANTAYRYDGTDGVTIATYADQIITSDVRSMHCWFRADATVNPVAGEQVLMEVVNGYGLYVEYGILKARRPGQTLPYDTGVWVADGEWHHVALTWDDDGAFAFVDGQICALNDMTPGAGDARFQMAGRKVTPSDPVTDAMDGDLDEVAIFSRKLTPDEVVAHYEGGLDVWN